VVPSGLALTPPDGERRSPSTGPPADPGLDVESSLTFPEVDGVDGLEDAVTVSTKSGSAKAIRGSSLLLAGRMISLGTNFLVQVLIVRYLTDKSDYGAFAYALSVVTILTTFVALGTDRAIGRFLPIYQERGRPDAMLGTVVFVAGTIASLGIASILFVYGFQDLVNGSLLNDQAGELLLILVILAPIQALDDVLMNGFAVFSSPRAIFFRRYVLNPVLRLAVVGLLIFGKQDVEFLAIGYVATGAIGVAVYAFLFARLLRKVGVLPRSGRPQMSFPMREILAFSVPLLTTDLVYILLNSSDVVLLGAITSDAEAVANYRVIQPVAALNLIVLQSFTLLFIPATARLFARNDREGLRSLYWQTAAWVAVLSFPIFALTFALAKPLTVALFEQRYASSAVYLAIIALGRYYDAALGFNGLTLRVFGNMKAVVGVNLAAAGVNLALLLLLIPPLGALGAAIATGSTLLVFNSLKQYALHRYVGVSLFERQYARVYLTIVLTTLGMLVVEFVIDPPLIVGLVLVGLASLAVLFTGRQHLQLADTFPELARLPLLRRIIG
jgi:O-antigen/teichoic acid export membrane protein